MDTSIAARRRSVLENRRIVLGIVHELKGPFDQTEVEKAFKAQTGDAIRPESLYSYLHGELTEELGVLAYENYRYRVRIPQRGT